MRTGGTWAGLVAAQVFLAAGYLPGVDPFGVTGLTPGAIVLQTGGASALIRTNLAWSAPTNLSHPALVFALGFGTDEIIVPGEFLDAVSVTLRNGDRTYVAPVVAADAFGWAQAPANPDGDQLGVQAVQLELLNNPDLVAGFPSSGTYLVMVVLPAALAGQSGTLGLNLFNNGDNQHSLAFMNHVRVVPGPGTLLELQSSAALSGPYAPEGQVSVRHARQGMVMLRPGVHRFYRLQSGVATRLTSMQPVGGDWLFRYTGATGNVAPILESSAQVSGPYAVEGGVRADLPNQMLRVRQEGQARFYQIRCEVPLAIRQIGMEGNQIVFSYEQILP